MEELPECKTHLCDRVERKPSGVIHKGWYQQLAADEVEVQVVVGAEGSGGAPACGGGKGEFCMAEWWTKRHALPGVEQRTTGGGDCIALGRKC